MTHSRKTQIRAFFIAIAVLAAGGAACAAIRWWWAMGSRFQ